MRVAVVTPFFNTPDEWLDQCIASVQAQTVPCTHFLVSDGNPDPAFPALETVQGIQLPQPHADAGNVARAVGSVSAISQGFDAIAYLDADNWYQPNHIASLVALHQQTHAAVCTSDRTLHHVDGSLLGVCLENDGETHVDTSCLLITREAFGLVSVWYLMEPIYGVGCDRVFWENIKAWNLSYAHSHAPTLAFRTRYRNHYLFYGVEPPESVKESILWPPPGSAGIPIWSPLFLKHYQSFQLPIYAAKPPGADVLTTFGLKTVNVMVFPDWSQPEDVLHLDLMGVIKSLLLHPDRSQIALLIKVSQISDDDANLVVCDVVMRLMLEEELDINEELNISLIGTLSDAEWQALLPHIHYKISLTAEDTSLISQLNLAELPQ